MFFERNELIEVPLNHFVPVSTSQVPKHPAYRLKRFFVYYKREPIDVISLNSLGLIFLHIDIQKQKSKDQDGGHHGDITQR